MDKKGLKIIMIAAILIAMAIAGIAIFNMKFNRINYDINYDVDYSNRA